MSSIHSFRARWCVGLVGLMLASWLANLALAQPPQATSRRDWQIEMVQRLPLLGHRNWIVIADAAYPAQARAGIETVYVGGDQLDAVRHILRSVDAARHVRAVVYTDQELDHVSDEDAPGINQYRQQLQELLKDRQVASTPHEQIIEQLDKAAETFRVIVYKTDLTIPYTSVFIELDCGYWSETAEKRLRARMQDGK
jgi:hypothetical protein